MIRKGQGKEEILMMLSEVNSQLELFENELNVSLAEMRTVWFADQEERLSLCSDRLEALETQYSNFKEQKQDYQKKEKSQGLKLELGFSYPVK
ncbi:hypothetical protein [Mesobacillus harenae]|uniref:hypothetical protein n=1 Tax=Mesobacillus harenae TaxID=2213203 RepID=UPI00157FEE9D|nr:hypothetical protein [Mesobacillus harenae]